MDGGFGGKAVRVVVEGVGAEIDGGGGLYSRHAVTLKAFAGGGCGVVIVKEETYCWRTRRSKAMAKEYASGSQLMLSAELQRESVQCFGKLSFRNGNQSEVEIFGVENST